MFFLLPLFGSVNIILLAAAVIPAVFLLIYVYKQDKLEKESWGLIFKLVLFGAISTAFAQITESIGIAILPYIFQAGSKAYNFFLYFVIVAVSEEGFKYLILKWRTWNNPEFNCRFDGIVYATAVGLGFALWENVSYVLSYGFGVAVVRAITAVPGHACFGVFMGAFYGSAKQNEVKRDYSESSRCKAFTLAVPIILHGAYDYIASSSSSGTFIFIIFIAALFFLAYKTVKRLSSSDTYIDRTEY